MAIITSVCLGLLVRATSPSIGTSEEERGWCLHASVSRKIRGIEVTRSRWGPKQGAPVVASLYSGLARTFEQEGQLLEAAAALEIALGSSYLEREPRSLLLQQLLDVRRSRYLETGSRYDQERKDGILDVIGNHVCGPAVGLFLQDDLDEASWIPASEPERHRAAVLAILSRLNRMRIDGDEFLLDLQSRARAELAAREAAQGEGESGGG